MNAIAPSHRSQSLGLYSPFLKVVDASIVISTHVECDNRSELVVETESLLSCQY